MPRVSYTRSTEKPASAHAPAEISLKPSVAHAGCTQQFSCKPNRCVTCECQWAGKEPQRSQQHRDSSGNRLTGQGLLEVVEVPSSENGCGGNAMDRLASSHVHHRGKRACAVSAQFAAKEQVGTVDQTDPWCADSASNARKKSSIWNTTGTYVWRANANARRADHRQHRCAKECLGRIRCA